MTCCAAVVGSNSWGNHADNLRASYRNRNHVWNRNNNLGFRPCLVVSRGAHALQHAEGRPCRKRPGQPGFITGRPNVVRRGSNWWVVDQEKLLAFAARLRPIRSINPSWDTNELLTQQGRFYLCEVSRYLPFGPQALRHQASIGKAVAIEKVDGVYLVDMEPFSEWIIKLWETVKEQ